MKAARPLALACLVFVLMALPTDLSNIWSGLFHPDPTATLKLALGLSLKVLTGTLSVLGLWWGKTFGFTFLLASSAQCLLICLGTLASLNFNFAGYSKELAWPALEALFRTFCLVFLGWHWRLLVGVREEVEA